MAWRPFQEEAIEAQITDATEEKADFVFTPRPAISRVENHGKDQARKSSITTF
jgi:hypothetical protein